MSLLATFADFESDSLDNSHFKTAFNNRLSMKSKVMY